MARSNTKRRRVGDRFAKLWNTVTEWSDKTFGTREERGAIGPLKHMIKEIKECIKAIRGGYDRDAIGMEFSDLQILVCDAARRQGFTPDELVEYGLMKMEINKVRKYDKPKTPDAVSEHDRSLDAQVMEVEFRACPGCSHRTLRLIERVNASHDEAKDIFTCDACERIIHMFTREDTRVEPVERDHADRQHEV